MKINEIAINENKYDLIRKVLPRIEKLPGETMKDAITRAKSELGGVKSADNLISPEELAALRRDPVPSSSGPAVWRNPRTGEVSSVPPAGGGRVPPGPQGTGVTVDQLRTPAAGTASMNIDSARRAAQANATKRAAAPKPAETPASDTVTLPKDVMDRILKLAERDPAAAQAAAKEAGIDPSKLGNMFTRNPWKTGIVAAAIPDLYNQFSPPTAPKFPYTPGEGAVDAFSYAGKNFMANQNIPGIKSVTPVSNNDQPVTPPTQDAVDKAKKTDPENQSVTKEIDDWNKKHPDNPIKESYTNELNRMVFLSRP